jgi:copper(I)-binding protein
MTNHAIPSRSVGRRRALLSAAAAALALLLVACGSNGSDGAESATSTTEAAGITVRDPWIRTPAAGQSDAACYLSIVNRTGTDDALVSASVPDAVAAAAELHETVKENGGSSGGMSSPTMGSTDMGSGAHQMGGGSGSMMTMRKVDRIAVPAHGTTSLEPGGYHIMLVGLKRTLAAGDEVQVTLTFASGRTLEVKATVRDG